MKIRKELFPVIALVLMLLLDIGDAFLLVQATGNTIYLTLALIALPLFLVILVVVLFRLQKEPDSNNLEKGPH
jgi:hypothetical protein